MWSSRLSIYCSILLSFCFYVHSNSNIEPISFGIITNDDFNQESIITTIMTLYWDQSSYECTIEPSKSNHLYECDIEESRHKTMQSDINRPKRLELSSSDHLSIKSVVVWDDNNDYHEISSFCVMDTNNCKDSIAILSAIIQFPIENVLTYSPNQSHRGYIEYINNEKKEQPLKRRLVGVNTDTYSYMEIKISSLSGSGTNSTNTLRVSVYWDSNAFRCTFGTAAAIADSATLYCFDNQATALPQDTTIPLNESYRLKFEYMFTGDDNDLLRIDSVKIYLKGGTIQDYYEIDQFCVPKQFNSSNTIIPNQKCTEYPHKYLTDVVELNGKFVHAFYLEFIDGIINNYVNEAHVGRVKASEPIDFTIKLTEGAASNIMAVEYALWWDEYIYHCTGKNSSLLTVHCAGSDITSNIECDLESDFKVHIFNPGELNPPTLESVIKIDSISVRLGTGTYEIGNFCIPNSYSGVHVTGTNVGSCTNNEFTGIDKWEQVCAGDGTAACSDKSIDIKFPQNLFAFESFAVGAMEGEVIDAGNFVAPQISCSPTPAPTDVPTTDPTIDPTNDPTTSNPTTEPTMDPTNYPTMEPTNNPTLNPTTDPSNNPTADPTTYPTFNPTTNPSSAPTYRPNTKPIVINYPSSTPSINPTVSPSIDVAGSVEETEGNPLIIWFNEDDVNKIIAGVGVIIILLICCLICYICHVKQCCCFKKGDAEPNIHHDHVISHSTEKLKRSSDGTNMSSPPSIDAIVSNPEPQQTEMTAIDSNMSGSGSLQNPRKVSNMIVPHRDEFIVTFISKPFGMQWSTLKTDKYNLYVSKVEANSFASQQNIKLGAKLVAINGESIEGIGSKKIYERVNQAGLPLSIMFRRRSKRDRKMSKRRKDTVPSQSGEGIDDMEGSFDDIYEPGTPLQSPSDAANVMMPKIQSINLDASAVYSHNKQETNESGSDSDDGMYAKEIAVDTPCTDQHNTPHTNNAHTGDQTMLINPNGAQSHDGVELQIAIENSDIPQQEQDKSSSEDEENEEMYNKDNKANKVTTKDDNNKNNEDSDSLVFQT